LLVHVRLEEDPQGGRTVKGAQLQHDKEYA
jgi:hypothetical protein